MVIINRNYTNISLSVHFEELIIDLGPVLVLLNKSDYITNYYRATCVYLRKSIQIIKSIDNF